MTALEETISFSPEKKSPKRSIVSSQQTACEIRGTGVAVRGSGAPSSSAAPHLIIPLTPRKKHRFDSMSPPLHSHPASPPPLPHRPLLRVTPSTDIFSRLIAPLTHISRVGPFHPPSPHAPLSSYDVCSRSCTPPFPSPCTPSTVALAPPIPHPTARQYVLTLVCSPFRFIPCLSLPRSAYPSPPSPLLH